MDSMLKKEYTVSKGLFVPVYPNIASAPEPVIGGFAYDNSTQSLLLSDGITWYAPAPNATPTGRGAVFGTTSEVDPSATGLGFRCYSTPGENVSIGFLPVTPVSGAQTGLTFLGDSAGRSNNLANNRTFIGKDAGGGPTTNCPNATGIGRGVMFIYTGTDSCAIGDSSQNGNSGSQNCSIGDLSLGFVGGPFYDNCIAIGNLKLRAAQTCNGVINIGAAPVEWIAGNSTDVIYIGNGITLSSNITNVVALGSGVFSGAAVPNNTFAITDDTTQWRSLGLSVAASANVLQFDPVTGIITQAASSRRFKENIREAQKIPSLEKEKVCTYEINGRTDHGLIAEDIPDFYSCSDSKGKNGVMMTRIIMGLLKEVQKLRDEIEKEKKSRQ
ncbi:hypothetical protein ISTM_320 [Insectomime virus]|nr:hypothetical protein ISTM_320 [Insectomime virus]